MASFQFKFDDVNADQINGYEAALQAACEDAGLDGGQFDVSWDDDYTVMTLELDDEVDVAVRERLVALPQDALWLERALDDYKSPRPDASVDDILAKIAAQVTQPH